MIGRLVCAILLACPFAAAAQTPCALQRITSLELGADSAMRPTVPIAIGGHPLNALIDTGGLFSMITQKTANDLGLAPHPIRDGALQMFHGQMLRSFVEAPNVQLGSLTAAQLGFLIMPDVLTGGVGATLAPDILRNYDVELDYAGHKFNLFKPKPCEGQAVYWTKQTSAVVPLRFVDGYHVRVAVKVNGVELFADVDTGADVSVMPRLVAHRFFGLSGEAPSDSLKFTSLSLDGVEVTNPAIEIPQPDEKVSLLIDHFILGNSVLRRLHLYIAYRERKLYVTAADAR